jgi:hypothetical protein
VPENPSIDYAQALDDASAYTDTQTSSTTLGTGPASINVQAWLEAKEEHERRNGNTSSSTRQNGSSQSGSAPIKFSEGSYYGVPPSAEGGVHVVTNI